MSGTLLEGRLNTHSLASSKLFSSFYANKS